MTDANMFVASSSSISEEQRGLWDAEQYTEVRGKLRERAKHRESLQKMIFTAAIKAPLL